VHANYLIGDGSAISAIQSSNVTDFASNVTRIETLETDLGSNVTRIENLETDLGSNVTRIETLETDLGSNVTRIENLETDLGSNVTRIETLETDLGSNVTRIATLETDLGSNVTRIATLETDLGSNVTRIENLESGAFVSSLWTDGADSLYYRSNVEVGTSNLFVDTTTSRVGINTATPGYDLDVNGDINFTGTLYQNGSIFSGGGGGSSVWTTSGSDIYYNTGGVGIGTSSPNEKLEIYDTSSTSSGIRIHDSTSNAPKIDFLRGGTSRIGSQTQFGLSDYSDWRIQANGPSLYIYNQYTGANSGSLKNVMTMLHNSGYVGIGTTNPAVKLDVNGYISHNNPVFYAHNFGNGGGTTSPNNYIVYKNTEVNVGSNFSTSTGIFTCPRNGVYKFTWGAIGGNTSTVYRYYIRINNANIINGTHNRIDNTASGSNYGNGTSSIILPLSTNDTVRIYYIADNNMTDSYGFNYDIFMGYMISA